jgi:Fe-S-cluster-containing dehydrogenase component
MGMDRRKFLKIAGLSTLFGLGGKTAFELLAPGEVEAELSPDPKALVAKRWAIVIDMKHMDEETERRCIEACHRIHNVPKMENPRHEIKWIWTEMYGHAFPGQEHEYVAEEIEEKPFLLLCNHCGNPPCCRVCPTKATWQREDGVVMMDQHRCIGCRFCMAACPFGARSFNWLDPRPKNNPNRYIKDINMEYPTRARGVVEKCNLCAERLAEGNRPACVEASEGKMFFGDLEDPESEVRKVLRSHYTIRRKSHLGSQPNVYYIV